MKAVVLTITCQTPNQIYAKTISVGDTSYLGDESEVSDEEIEESER